MQVLGNEKSRYYFVVKIGVTLPTGNQKSERAPGRKERVISWEGWEIDEEDSTFRRELYRVALDTAQPYRLTEKLTIRILTPPLFIATKLEAYLGRGNDDHDDNCGYKLSLGLCQQP